MEFDIGVLIRASFIEGVRFWSLCPRQCGQEIFCSALVVTSDRYKLIFELSSKLLSKRILFILLTNPIPADSYLYLTQRSGPYSFASQTAVFWDTTKRKAPMSVER